MRNGEHSSTDDQKRKCRRQRKVKRSSGNGNKGENWYGKMQYFVVRKPRGVDHMRLEIMNLRTGKYYPLDQMQGEHSYQEIATTDEEGYAQQTEVITRLGEEITKYTVNPIRNTEWRVE